MRHTRTGRARGYAQQCSVVQFCAGGGNAVAIDADAVLRRFVLVAPAVLDSCGRIGDANFEMLARYFPDNTQIRLAFFSEHRDEQEITLAVASETHDAPGKEVQAAAIRKLQGRFCRRFG